MVFLFEAIEEDDITDVKNVIKEGANVNIKNKNGETPLHRAVRLHYIELAETLINYGADVNTEDEHGITPLHTTTEVLLKAGLNNTKKP